MAVCASCGERYLWGGLEHRLAIPEYRAMTGFWPWVSVRVCSTCLDAYDREFVERLHLLAPGVLENDEPVAQQVCLACGTISSHGPWRGASRWVTADGKPTRRAKFFLCDRHADLPYVEGIIVSSNLTSLERMKSVLAELPSVGSDLLARVEKWRPEDGTGPAGARAFTPTRRRDDAAVAAKEFWSAAAPGLEAKAAWLGPIRKDYRMRYRLDLVHDYTGGRRETFSVVRLGRDRFATYRTDAQKSAAAQAV